MPCCPPLNLKHDDGPMIESYEEQAAKQASHGQQMAFLILHAVTQDPASTDVDHRLTGDVTESD